MLKNKYVLFVVRFQSYLLYIVARGPLIVCVWKYLQVTLSTTYEKKIKMLYPTIAAGVAKMPPAK